MIRALRGYGVFAADCEIAPTEIKVGILAIDPDMVSGRILTLIDVDAEKQGILNAYPVELTESQQMATHNPYQSVLKRCLTQPTT